MANCLVTIGLLTIIYFFHYAQEVSAGSGPDIEEYGNKIIDKLKTYNMVVNKEQILLEKHFRYLENSTLSALKGYKEKKIVTIDEMSNSIKKNGRDPEPCLGRDYKNFKKLGENYEVEIQNCALKCLLSVQYASFKYIDDSTALISQIEKKIKESKYDSDKLKYLKQIKEYDEEADDLIDKMKKDMKDGSYSIEKCNSQDINRYGQEIEDKSSAITKCLQKMM